MRSLIVLFLLLSSTGAEAQKTKFPIHKCPVPFNEEATQGLIIDRVCGLTGNADTPAKQRQDERKNNLCAGGSARAITIAELVELQEKFDAKGIPYGNTFNHKPGPPADRSVFQKLPALSTGNKFEEGDIVMLTAFLVESHYSPSSSSGSGESSNCSLSEHEMADIHIALRKAFVEIKKKDPQRQAKLCHSVTAEIVPHLRPEEWQNDFIQEAMKLERPVRLTGQLFFDGSHQPCTGETPRKGDPQRAAVWEIHPVYRIEVCKHDAVADCGAAAENWEPISAVPELQPSEEPQ